MILSEKYLLIQKMFRDYMEREFPTDLQDEIDQTGEYPYDKLKKMGEMGFFGIKTPKELGGQGGDTLAYVLAIEQVSRVNLVTGVWLSGANSLGSGPLMFYGTDEQIQKYLVPTAQGKRFPCFMLTEPGAGSDAGGVTTQAVRDGDEWVINGRKAFITAAHYADFGVLFARTTKGKGNKGISAFVIDMNTPGITLGKPENKMGIIGCPTSDVIFENVRVPASALLGEQDRGFINAMKTLDYGRLGVSAQSIGVAQACLEEATKYAKERKQFGRRIADFQGISFMLADMATELEAGRQLLYHAAQYKDTGASDAGMYCSMAKLYCAEAVNHIATKAMQIHGGYGYIKDYRIERLFRDARVNALFEGTSQVQQIVVSGNLLK